MGSVVRRVRIAKRGRSDWLKRVGMRSRIERKILQDRKWKKLWQDGKCGKERKEWESISLN